jgi:hypothetical protein
VLFSPIAPSLGQTETTSTERTPRTAGLSRFSDIGSLLTGAPSRSELADDLASELQSEFVEDDGELDSLDDGLHAFRDPVDLGSPRQRMMSRVLNDTVLPSHDGMGSFPNILAAAHHVERTAQPPRKQRRTSNAQQTLDALHEAEEQDEDEKRMRIEQWRLDQSRALLEEVRKESQRIRRQASMASTRAASVVPSVAGSRFQTKSEYNFSESSEAPGARTPVAALEPQEPVEPQVRDPTPPENESFWKRITRRVIRDLIGIDEEILSVILGESPPPQEQISYSMKFHERLLSRLARELGILVYQLSEHPGAFTTYLRTQEPIPYVGATSPLIPSVPQLHSANQHMSASMFDSPTSHHPSVLFSSTLRHNPANAVAPNADPSLWGIEEDDELTDPATQERLRREQEYWEQDLDIGMVFDFLRKRLVPGATLADDMWSSRPAEDELGTTPTPNTVGLAAAGGNIPFSISNPHTSELLRQSGVPRLSRPTPTSHPMPSSLTPARLASVTPEHTHARAALIRAHHPLAAGRTSNMSVSQVNTTTTASNIISPVRRYSGDQLISSSHVHSSTSQVHAFSSPRRSLARRSNASSCASQSTRRSRLASSGGGGVNYWDWEFGDAAGSVSSPGWGGVGGDGIST